MDSKDKQNKNNKKSKKQAKKSSDKKLTSKEKAMFSAQNSVDMFPVDPYND